MNDPITGLHHVTAITADAQKNIDFYCGVLGLRLVKLTVNFDDPSSYHLYYGDELGRPGSVLTFFAWPGAPRGRVGQPQVTTTAFSVPGGSLGFWSDRLQGVGVQVKRSPNLLGEESVFLEDPDGMRLALVGAYSDGRRPWEGGGVPANRAIRGFHGVTLAVETSENTSQLLTRVMGFRRTQERTSVVRFEGGEGGPGAIVDVICTPSGRGGALGAGIVHHVAFRAASDEAQLGWQNVITAMGHNVSPVMDRTYFHSIYFREPGGVLFEIATDGPGFTADEAPEALGTSLRLPPWLEGARATAERSLPRVKLPDGRTVGGDSSDASSPKPR